MKRGLVLEGGAMRGLFTAGVTDVLMENGVEFDGAVGVSAGACFGVNYKSNQPGRVLRYNLRYCGDPRYCGVQSLLRTGDVFGAEFCYHTLPEALDPFDYDAFERNPMEFYVVCTDVQTGEAVYHRMANARGEEMEWLRASASMPLVSRTVRAGGREMLDGGAADSIPLAFFESIGYDRNVVVLTQPAGYVKAPNRQIPLMRAAMRKTPGIVNAMARRHEVYNAQTAYVRRRAQEGAIICICPAAPLEIGHIERNPDRLRRVYEAGRRAGMENLEHVRAFLRE